MVKLKDIITLKTLSQRLALSFVLIGFALVALSLISAHFIFSINLKSYLSRTPETVAEEIADGISKQMAKGKKLIDSRPFINDYANKYGALIVIYDVAGNELIRSGRGITQAQPWCQGVMRGMGARMVTVPIRTESDLYGFVGVILSRESPIAAAEESFKRTVNTSLLFAGGMALIIAILFGIFLTNAISKPVNEAIKGAESLAAGDFNIRLQVRDDSEIGHLSHSINMLADRLKELEKRRMETASDIAHEFKTPLAVLKANLEAMLDGVMPIGKKNIRNMVGEIDRLSALVDELKEIRLLEAGGKKLKIYPLDIVALLKSKLPDYRLLAKKKRITLKVKEIPKEILILGNKEKIIQVLNNLFANALKYTESNGEITLEVKGYENKAEVSVSDTGVGISPGKLPMVFERFYTADESRSRQTGGSGLGLSIAKKLIELMGGSISIESEVSKGTKVILTFIRSRSENAD